MGERWPEHKKEQLLRIGPLVRLVRLYYGHSQKEFCEKVGVSQGFLSKIESSASSPDVIVWLNFTANFDINAYCILDRTRFESECKKFADTRDPKIRRLLNSVMSDR